MSCPEPPNSKKQKMSNSQDELDCKNEKKEERENASSVLQSFFNYKFNEAGVLVDITTGDGFNFQFSEDHQYNQERYESIGGVITDYVYELLESPDVGLKKMEIPLNAKNNHAKGFIFVSEDFNKKEKLLVLVHGSGVVRAGQWARRLIINDCLDHGTQIPYIKRALQEGYGVVVLNTNQNLVEVTNNGRKHWQDIKDSETPERHFSYVWKNIIEKTKSSKMYIVAHSYGGYLVVGYFMNNKKVLNRVVAVAFTDSVHSLNYHSNGKVRDWFEKNSVNWVSSSKDLDTPMDNQCFSEHVTRVSAGTTKHEETSWKAMGSVFRYFDYNTMDSSQQTKGDNGVTSDDSSCNLDQKSSEGNSEAGETDESFGTTSSGETGDAADTTTSGVANSDTGGTEVIRNDDTGSSAGDKTGQGVGTTGGNKLSDVARTTAGVAAGDGTGTTNGDQASTNPIGVSEARTGAGVAAETRVSNGKEDIIIIVEEMKILIPIKAASVINDKDADDSDKLRL